MKKLPECFITDDNVLFMRGQNARKQWPVPREYIRPHEDLLDASTRYCHWRLTFPKQICVRRHRQQSISREPTGEVDYATGVDVQVWFPPKDRAHTVTPIDRDTANSIHSARMVARAEALADA